MATALSLNAKAKSGLEVDEDMLQKFALTCQGSLSPMAAIFGGIVGQEVLKACSGKFTPIQQFLYFDAFECLPETIAPADYALTKSRYDGQVGVRIFHGGNFSYCFSLSFKYKLSYPL